jgi:putative peptidoglycan lipid II flippase
MSQIMFPIVVLLGLNGLVVGILNTYDHFSIPAIAPLVWNVVIIAFMAGLKPFFEPAQEVYAYAIGILVGTAVQFAMALPVLRRVGFPLKITFHRDPRIRQVLRLMLPVTIGLGLINFNLIINSVLGTLVSEEAPRAIDAAFRIYMLPQGMFSVAVATVLYPTLSRLAANKDLDGLRQTSALGVRQIFLLLVPAAAATLALAEPITRLIYERGPFDADDTRLVAEALFWFSFSLPFSGANLMLTRTFFSLQEPWAPTRFAGYTLVVNVVVALLLYEPLGVGGIVIGTAVSTAAMTVLQAFALRKRLNGIEARRTILALIAQLLAAAYLGCAAYLVHTGIQDLIGESFIAQVVAVGTALTAASALYGAILLYLDLPEARQVLDLIRRRLPGRDR